MQRHFLLLIFVAGASGCYFPAVYSKSFKGTVVDKDLAPVPDATVLLTVFKECGSVGGRTAPVMKEVRSMSKPDGSFQVSAKGIGLYSFSLLGGCDGYSKQLRICKDGFWTTGYQERPGGPISTTVTASGAYVFDPGKMWKNPSGDYLALGKRECTR